MVKYAVIDIGTNSVKLSIFRVSGNNLLWDCDKIKISRIGENVYKTNLISQLGIDRTIQVFEEWKHLFRTVKEIRIVGTMAFRLANNSIFFTKIILRNIKFVNLNNLLSNSKHPVDLEYTSKITAIFIKSSLLHVLLFVILLIISFELWLLS